MSQRILKCIICGGHHSIFQCPNKCAVCNGDNRQCSCTDQPPAKKKKTANKRREEETSSSQGATKVKEANHLKELQRLYDNLKKDYERVSLSFRNQRQQNEQIEAECEEANKDAEELANLVRTKDEVIKKLESKLAEAKKNIADLKAEVQALRSNRPDNPQQQQQRDSSRVSTHSLSGIHQRYEKVLQVLEENSCSMANAFRLAGCPRSTLRDFVAIAELKIVDSREHDLVIRDLQGESVKELEAICRRRLRRYIPVMANMRREGKLLPLKFDERFYE